MKPRPRPSKAAARTARTAAASNTHLEKMLSLIGAHPGIRPSELNRLLEIEQSDGLRATLIRRGLIRKEKHGAAVRYYLV